jgi:MFS family permease
MILAGGTAMIIGTILLGSSTTLAQLLIGRIVTGIGNGFNSSTIPMYQSEMCKPRNRGILLSMQGTVTIIGLCIAYWLDFGLSFAKGPIQWRLPISFQAFFAICLVLQMLPLPETPRYLIEKGHHTAATEVLAASFIPPWTVEKFGRTALLMFSAAGLCFCFSMTSILLSIGTKSTAYAATAFEFIFQIFLGIGWLPIPWFYPSEVTTTRIRSRGQALGAFVNWSEPCFVFLLILAFVQYVFSSDHFLFVLSDSFLSSKIHFHLISIQP